MHEQPLDALTRPLPRESSQSTWTADSGHNQTRRLCGLQHRGSVPQLNTSFVSFIYRVLFDNHCLSNGVLKLCLQDKIIRPTSDGRSLGIRAIPSHLIPTALPSLRFEPSNLLPSHVVDE